MFQTKIYLFINGIKCEKRTSKTKIESERERARVCDIENENEKKRDRERENVCEQRQHFENPTTRVEMK